MTAPPNPGPPDTSYGLAGDWDCRGCDQAPCSESAQKRKSDKGPGLYGHYQVQFRPPPAAYPINNPIKSLAPHRLPGHATVARGECPFPRATRTFWGEGASPEIPETKKEKKEELSWQQLPVRCDTSAIPCESIRSCAQCTC